jgi:PKD repeat protein
MYAAAASYTITLTVTDSLGQTDTTILGITVDP